MAVHRPWRDLPSVLVWNEACRREAEQNWLHNTIKNIRAIGSRNKTTVSVEDFARRIALQLTAYHALQKADENTFPTRIVKLRAVAKMASEFLTKFDWDFEYSKTWNQNKHDAEQNLARLAFSIQNRGLAKAAYLETLQEFLHGGKKGSTPQSMAQLISKFQNKTLTTIGLSPNVRLERYDPFHRSLEGVYKTGGGKESFSGDTPFGLAFAEWFDEYVQDKENTPHFYVWLENHHTTIGGFNEDSFNEEKQVGSVRYGTRSLGWCKTLVQSMSPVHWMNPDGGQPEVANTVQQDIESGRTKYFRDVFIDGKTIQLPGAAAFVWDTSNTVFIFAHMWNSQHHSSPLEGGKVKCAGNIIIENGMITYVDSYSGHYKPTQAYLRNFCFYLEREFSLEGNAVIGYFGQGLQSTQTTWEKFKTTWVSIQPSKDGPRKSYLS